jgi:chromosome segregation protein
VYLKSLTLRGFKSFASATTLRLEPGITCVVGPNGSGKSNVVDALAWVMGEQGAKSLRGGKMEDVIFAGTAGSTGRPPLGRAEVSLTIDNTDGALPIDYTEVTISRTMFRGGGSEYAINGTPSRLLDVQELLSDSGIGREMHVIVGQGQLDAVLHATPEERRGFIEEAAGVLKHRKRKEKALRKLEAMEANLTRLSDLTSEIRRQLGPLGRQAEVARRASVVQADVRDARLRLIADDLVQLRSALEQEDADESQLRARQDAVDAELRTLRAREAELEAAAVAAAPALTRAQDTWYRLTSLHERLLATQGLAQERLRLLAEEPTGTDAPRRDPQELSAEAEQARAQERELAEATRAAQAGVEQAVASRQQAELAHAEEQAALVRMQRAAADRREGLARLAGQVAARRSRVDAAQAEIGRLEGVLAEAEQRGAAAELDFAALESQVAGAEQGEKGLDAEHERATEVLAATEAEVESLVEQERAAERDRATWTARHEALKVGLARKDGAGALLAAGDRVSGLLGSVAALVRVQAGHETAVAAALGTVADAVAVDSMSSAVSALRMLRADDAGRAGLLVGSAEASPRPAEGDRSRWPVLPETARWAVDLVDAPSRLRTTLERILDQVAVVTDLDAARSLVQDHPEVTAVTADGDVLAPGRAHGGSPSAPSLLEVQAALDEAEHEAAAAVRRVEQARFALAGARDRLATARGDVQDTLDRLHDSDARLAAVAERLGQLGATVRAAHAEADRTRRALAEAQEARSADEVTLAELQERLTAAQEEPGESEPSGERVEELARVASSARAAETEARLSLRTGEERVRAVAARAQQLEQAVVDELAARERLARLRERRQRQAETARAVELGAAYTAGLVTRALSRAGADREEAEQARIAREGELSAARRRVAELADELRELTDSVHRDEMARTQQQVRIETLEAKAIDELGVDPTVLVEEFGPHLMVPPSPPPPGEDAAEAAGREPVPYVREQQEKRLRSAERAMSLLGRVNPLALEEFTALEERHAFLSTQVEDLRSSRRDLMEVVREVDERVQQVFAAAYQDTAEQFERVFARLFPGGEGRLVLTDPDDLLNTGIEVEARPPGKKVKRLSLLSGGERSLTAVALLVAIFKARPSPFYVMDEVEAALDDTNLGRLLILLEELRESSQLIVITHQKRTMEVADALYGVTMRGDGVTAVVSQRLREAQPA